MNMTEDQYNRMLNKQKKSPQKIEPKKEKKIVKKRGSIKKCDYCGIGEISVTSIETEEFRKGEACIDCIDKLRK